MAFKFFWNSWLIVPIYCLVCCWWIIHMQIFWVCALTLYIWINFLPCSCSNAVCSLLFAIGKKISKENCIMYWLQSLGFLRLATRVHRPAQLLALISFPLPPPPSCPSLCRPNPDHAPQHRWPTAFLAVEEPPLKHYLVSWSHWIASCFYSLTFGGRVLPMLRWKMEGFFLP